MSGGPQILVRRSPRALWRSVSDEIVATTALDSETHHLLGGAGAVWEELAVPESRDGLITRLAGRFDVPLEELSAQVTACIDELISLGLVEEVEIAHA